MTESFQIAQINVATASYPLEDPRMSGFVDQLDAINALADQSVGFVWRLQSDSGNATDIQVTDDPLLIVNMSVWQTVEALFDFVYKTAHTGVMVQRREWFARPSTAYQALWWVSAGHRPTAEEGLERLRHIDSNGPTPHAFTFKRRFPPPGRRGPERDLRPDPYCVGWS